MRPGRDDRACRRRSGRRRPAGPRGASGSMPTASPRMTVVLRCLRRIERSGWAMSPGRQRAGRDLVEQRLEEVEVAPVDEGQPDLRIDRRGCLRGVQAGEPPPTTTTVTRCGSVGVHVPSHGQPDCQPTGVARTVAARRGPLSRLHVRGRARGSRRRHDTDPGHAQQAARHDRELRRRDRPRRRAASMSPSRGPLVTTRMWIDVTRPRSVVGRLELDDACERNTAEKTSAAPATARKKSAQRERERSTSPNAVIARPQAATATRIARPDPPDRPDPAREQRARGTRRRPAPRPSARTRPAPPGTRRARATGNSDGRHRRRSSR